MQVHVLYSNEALVPKAGFAHMYCLSGSKFILMDILFHVVSQAIFHELDEYQNEEELIPKALSQWP